MSITQLPGVCTKEADFSESCKILFCILFGFTIRDEYALVKRLLAWDKFVTIRGKFLHSKIFYIQRSIFLL